MKKYLLLSLILSASAYSASIDHVQTYSPDYLSNQAQNGMINSVSAYYNPAGTSRLEVGKKYINAGLQYAVGYEKMSYKGQEHKAKLRQPIPNIAFTSVDDKGAYFVNFGALGGGGTLKYKNGVSGLDGAIEAINKKFKNDPKLKIAKIVDVGSNVTGSNMYEQLTLGRAFNIDDKLSVSAAGRIIHGTRELKGNLKLKTEGVTKFYNKYVPETLKSLEGNIDSKREAWGYGFQLGVNYKATEKLNLAARYDSRIKMNFKAKGSEKKLETERILKTDIGFSNFYPEYTKETRTRRDMPAILALGASYQVTDKWLVSTAGNFYFNKQAKMDRVAVKNILDGKKEDRGIDYKNGWELALGNEYKLNDKFTLIGSINYAKTGGSDKTYSDVEYALNSTMLGAGVRYKYDETLDMTFSAAHFFYKGSEGMFQKKYGTENQKYDKSITAVGFSISKKF